MATILLMVVMVGMLLMLLMRSPGHAVLVSRRWPAGHTRCVLLMVTTMRMIMAFFASHLVVPVAISLDLLCCSRKPRCNIWSRRWYIFFQHCHVTLNFGCLEPHFGESWGSGTFQPLQILHKSTQDVFHKQVVLRTPWGGLHGSFRFASWLHLGSILEHQTNSKSGPKQAKK